MSYYVRCFCANASVPALQEVIELVVTRHKGVRIDSPDGLRSREWKEAEIHYKQAKAPIDVELNRTSEVGRKIAGSLGRKQVRISSAKGEDKDVTLEELSRGAGLGTNPVKEEIAEFRKVLARIDDSPAKQQVIKHLTRTTFIVACRIPTSDIDDDGYAVNGDFLGYFVEHCDGMIQADGEGFYDGTQVLLTMK